MTRSRAIDRLRRRGRSVRLLRTWHEATPPAPGPFTPLERVSMQQCSERIRAALDALPDAERQVLELRSEERRVGKECRCGWSPYDEKKKSEHRRETGQRA